MEEKKKIKISLGMIISIFIIVLLVAVIVGMMFYYRNTNKTKKYTPITSDKFKSYIETQGFNTYNALETMSDSVIKEGIKSGYITHKNDNESFQVNFFELKDEAHTMYGYYDTVIGIEKNNTGEFNETSETISNYSKYTAFSNGYYYVLVRIDNTVLFAKVEKENKQLVDNILKELGY